MAKSSLPQKIYVSCRDEGTDDEWLLATADIENVLENDGPETIGVYKLESTKKLSKKVVEE